MLTKNDISIIKELLESNNKYLFSILATKEDVKKEVNRLDQKIDNFKDEMNQFRVDTKQQFQIVNKKVDEVQEAVIACMDYGTNISDHECRIVQLEKRVGI